MLMGGRISDGVLLDLYCINEEDDHRVIIHHEGNSLCPTRLKDAVVNSCDLILGKDSSALKSCRQVCTLFAV